MPNNTLLDTPAQAPQAPNYAPEPAWYSEPKGAPENPHLEPASGQSEGITATPEAPPAPILQAVPKPAQSEPLPSEAEALATVLGVRSVMLDLRGYQVKVRELEIGDLLPLFTWLDSLKDEAALFVSGKLTEEQKTALIKQAALKGVDLISLCTDGAIPPGKALPLGITAKLIGAILEVNADFFEELPTLIMLGKEFRAILPKAPSQASASAAAASQ